MLSIRRLYKIGNGPSSSHTMGPSNATKYIISHYGDATYFEVTLFGSLALTGKSFILFAPSNKLNSVWTCKCTKSDI